MSKTSSREKRTIYNLTEFTLLIAVAGVPVCVSVSGAGGGGRGLAT